MRQKEEKVDLAAQAASRTSQNDMTTIPQLYTIFKSCTGVTTDSRTLKGGEIFFALKGENFDGNEYALKALEAGAAYAVVTADSPVVSSRAVKESFFISMGRETR